jgi:medium-chain acyl-[acyl-carrier-protein] hydrolase
MDPYAVWQDQYDIKVYEADALGRASMITIADYVQNSAARHYTFLDQERGPFLPPNFIWAMSRMEMQVLSIPKWQDEVTLETWSRGVDRISAIREFRLMDKTGEAVVLGTTLWVVIDGSRRLHRLNGLSPKWPSLPDRTFINKTPDKVQELTRASLSAAFRTVYSDLDLNRHVNNVKYLQWMLDSYPQPFLERREVKRVELNFLDSASAGDEITVGTEQLSDSLYLNNVIRMRDGREVCRASLEFGPER